MSPSNIDTMLKEGPYGDFISFDPECPHVKTLERKRGHTMKADEAERHRAECERCMMLAVLSSEIIIEEGANP
jgi:hypothetical protein